MTVKFENYGRFYPALSFVNNETIEFRDSGPYSMKKAMDFIEDRMTMREDIFLGILCDYDTGEVVLCVDREDEVEEDYDSDYDDWGYNEDCGFDPYLGCFTDDC